MGAVVRASLLARAVGYMRPALSAHTIVRSRSSKTEDTQEGLSLLKYLTMKIKATGPITVAEYMREVLTNPIKGKLCETKELIEGLLPHNYTHINKPGMPRKLEGYYMHRDMLGEQGDFVTSPEISQIFGELIGIWCISEWIAGGRSKSLNLVELGPGRGSLMEDILRVLSQFQHLLNECDVSIHLVEVSPKLSEIQALKLMEENAERQQEDSSLVYKKGITKSGLPINWYYDIKDVPSGYTFYIAHEFFDALPIHKLQKVQCEWRDVLIDIDSENAEKLRFVLGSNSSLIAKTFIEANEKRDHVEVCPDAAVIIQKLAHQIKHFGGAALIADYGHTGQKEDTFRGFRAHQLHDVLSDPGAADLTADVDFGFLKRMVGDTVTSLGPVTQREFLRNMGIDLRMKVLLENTKDGVSQQSLIRSYDFLMNPNKMGERFKFLSIFPHERLEKKEKVNPSPVAGFTELEMR